jgi:branched-chain amino acid transport system substrate-binding protein
MILARAMEQGGTDAAAIKEALPRVIKEYQGATGTITWDEHGQRVDPPVEFLEYRDGKFEVLESTN